MTLLFAVLLVVAGCTSSPSDPSSVDENKAIDVASIPGFDAKEYEDTQYFQKWVTGTLTPSEKQESIKHCKKNPKHHPFCTSMLSSRYFEQWHRENAPPSEVATPRTVVIPDFEWSKGKILRWYQLRREKVSTLVKGLEKLPKEEVIRIANFAQKEKKCPNHVAGAAAARFEDFQDDASLLARAADLYEKAGRCSPRGSIEREQLLTRAALIHYEERRYEKAEKILSTVKPQDALAGRSLYWLLRSQMVLGRKDKAKKTLATLLGQYKFSFHALIAAHQFRGGVPEEWFRQGTPLPTRSTKSPRANTFLTQMELCSKYRFVECRESIADYFFEKVKKVESEVRIYGATFASPTSKIRNLQEIAIARADLRSRGFFEQLYPRPHLSEFEGQRDAEPALLFAVARKESQFDVHAVSIAQAIGLLQLQVPTAKRFQSDVEAKSLFQPSTNVNIAGRYMKELNDRYSNDFVQVLAAYNAGEEAVTRWKSRYTTNDPLLFLDLIPYRETRDYVGYVLTNLYWYRRLYYADGSPLKNVLPESALAVQNLD